ncbi:MAG: tetratricopeptide repeat protein [Dokdonella sp.]
MLQLNRGQPKDALAFIDRAASIRQRELPEQHPSAGFIAHMRARTLLDLGKVQPAIEQFELARQIRKNLADGRHPHLADTLIWLAKARQRENERPSDEIVALAEEASQISLDNRGPDDWRTLDIQLSVACCSGPERPSEARLWKHPRWIV